MWGDAVRVHVRDDWMALNGSSLLLYHKLDYTSGVVHYRDSSGDCPVAYITPRFHTVSLLLFSFFVVHFLFLSLSLSGTTVTRQKLGKKATGKRGGIDR